MKRLSPLVVRNLFLLVAVALLLAVLSRVEWEKKERDLGFTREAVRNPYLALERYLAPLGHPLQVDRHATNLGTLPPVQDVLVLRGTRRQLPPEQVTGLLDWVQRGGLLLLEANDSRSEEGGHNPDPLLEQLGLWREHHNAEEPDPVAAGKTGPTTGQCSRHGDNACGGLNLVLPGHTLPACVTLLHQYQRLAWDRSPPGLYASLTTPADPDHTQLVWLRHGQGQILVATELDLLENRQIDEGDNAYVLGWLLQGRGSVHVKERPGAPSLLATLFRPIPWSSTALAVALLLVAWHHLPRFGPVQHGTPSSWRSQYREHLRHSGRFLWRHRAADALSAPLRQAVAERVTMYRHRLGLPAGTDMVPHLAQLTRLPEDRLRRALAPTPAGQAEAFIESIQTLQILRSRL